MQWNDKMKVLMCHILWWLPLDGDLSNIASIIHSFESVWCLKQFCMKNELDSTESSQNPQAVITQSLTELLQTLLRFLRGIVQAQ